jgi:hypothetical protein
MRCLFCALVVLFGCSSTASSSGDATTGGGASAGPGGAGGEGGGGTGGGGAVEKSVVPLPGGESGIGFDDLGYSAEIDRVLAPGAGTGSAYLIEPTTLAVQVIDGFERVDSLDVGSGWLFVVDRAAGELVVVDPSNGERVGAAQIGGGDYVRWVATTSEAWVTEPGAHRIERFAVAADGTPTSVGTIDVPGGPEGVVIDATRGRAYAHQFSGPLAVIDIAGGAVVSTWPSGCQGAHGIPKVDEARGLVFAGCGGEGRVAVLDADADGALVGEHTLGGGETILAYSAELGHFYLRGDGHPEVAVLGVAADGALTLLDTVAAEPQGHGGTADAEGAFWICDATHGSVLRFPDPYAAVAP